MRTVAILVSSIVLLSGCALNLSSNKSAELKPIGNSVQIMLSTNHPIGLYTLETTDGQPVARGAIRQQPLRSSAVQPGIYPPVRMTVDVRRFPQARGCLRVRQPDGQILPLGPSGQPQFHLPALEAAYIQQVEIPDLQRAETRYDRNQRIVAETARWISTKPPELTATGSCRLPVASANTCQSDTEAREAAKKPCFEGNFACSIAGAGVDTIISQLGDENKTASTMANYLSANACSLAVDAQYGLQSDLMTYLRSIGVTLMVDTLYRSLVNKDPGVGETFALAAAAGTINYNLCLNDAVAQCRQSRSQWQRFANVRYGSCVNRLTEYQKATELLKFGSPAAIRQEIQLKHERVRKLSTRGVLQRIPPIAEVQSCS